MPDLTLREGAGQAVEVGKRRALVPHERGRRPVSRRRVGRGARGTRARLLTRASRRQDKTLAPRRCFTARHLKRLGERARGSLEAMPSGLRRHPERFHATAARARRGRSIVQVPATPARRGGAHARHRVRQQNLVGPAPPVPATRASERLCRPNSLSPRVLSNPSAPCGARTRLCAALSRRLFVRVCSCRVAAWCGKLTEANPHDFYKQ